VAKVKFFATLFARMQPQRSSCINLWDIQSIPSIPHQQNILQVVIIKPP